MAIKVGGRLDEDDELVNMLMKTHQMKDTIEDKEYTIEYRQVGIKDYAKAERDAVDDYELSITVFNLCVVSPKGLVGKGATLPVGFVMATSKKIIDESFLTYIPKKE